MTNPDILLFSEIYNCYYQVVDQILKEASAQPVTRQKMTEIAEQYGYQESALSIIPNLMNGTWPLLEKLTESFREPVYRSRLSQYTDPFSIPLTNLQKSWLKSLLLDSRIRLFLSDGQIALLESALTDTKALFLPQQFHSFDQYLDSDPFSSVQYRSHVQALLGAIKDKKLVNLSYYSTKGHILTYTLLPCRLEYGQKEGKFRLYAMSQWKNGRPKIDVLNVGRILSVENTGQTGPETASLDDFLDQSLCKDPLVLEITDERNALERVLLHFSCYQKKIERLDTSGRYRCSIYYDKRWETELLIQVLSFGPVIKVLGPDEFSCQVKERIRRQIRLMDTASYNTE